MAKINFGGLDVKARERLVHLCGKFGSDNENERASAASLADRFVHAHGLTWGDVIAAPAATHLQLVIEALSSREELSDLEIDFLRNAAGFGELSPKQQEWLDRIVIKVRTLKAAA
jgi:hypothetical protein